MDAKYPEITSVLSDKNHIKFSFVHRGQDIKRPSTIEIHIVEGGFYVVGETISTLQYGEWIHRKLVPEQPDNSHSLNIKLVES